VSKRDLFVVVADLDAENAIRTLLTERQHSLNVTLDFNPLAPVQGDLLRFNGRDSGCYQKAVDLLRSPQNTHRHAMLCFDRLGCGAESKPREEIEAEIEGQLVNSGWPADSVAVIVFDPELEAWVWAQSPQTAIVLGWKDDPHGLRPYLEKQNLWNPQASKPHDPKEAMARALRAKRQVGGARLFSELAGKVGLRSCQDPAFQKFRRKLAEWFPKEVE